MAEPEARAGGIPTAHGTLSLSLVLPEGGVLDLSFDPERDLAATAGVIQHAHGLPLSLMGPNRATEKFIVYLGAEPRHRDRDLAILLEKEPRARAREWIPRIKDRYRVEKSVWCAARATLTLCTSNFEPIRALDGRILQTRITLGDHPWNETLYHRVRGDLSREVFAADITSSLQNTLSVVRQARAQARGSRPLELYYRLRTELEPLDRILNAVLARPHCQPRVERRVFVLAPAAAAAFFRERPVRADGDDVVRAVPAGGRILPVEFASTGFSLSADNDANRYIARSVDRLLEWLRAVRGGVDAFIRSKERSLEQFLGYDREPDGARQATVFTGPQAASITRHRRASAELRAAELRFRRYRAALPTSPPTRGHSETYELSPALSFDSRYAEMRRIMVRLQRTLEYVDVSEEHVPFEVEPFAELYQRWCFVRVIEALLALGFRFEGGVGRLTTPLYHHPVPHQVNGVLTHPSVPGVRLHVWYERRYPRSVTAGQHLYGLEQRYRDGRTPVRDATRRTPDIALEFFREGEVVPRVVTLDPTLKKNDVAKFDYLQQIRSFVEGDVDPADANGRAGRPVVVAAWAIHPGEEDDTRLVTLDVDDAWDKGFLMLRPEPSRASVRQLPHSLALIFWKCGLTPASLVDLGS